MTCISGQLNAISTLNQSHAEQHGRLNLHRQFAKLLRVYRGLIVVKNFNFRHLGHEVGKFTFESCGANDVIVDPVIVTPARLIHQKVVVFESIFLQPILGDGPVFFGPRSKKCNDVAFIKPAIDNLQGVWVWRYRSHAFRLFVWHIITDGPVDIN